MYLLYEAQKRWQRSQAHRMVLSPLPPLYERIVTEFWVIQEPYFLRCGKHMVPFPPPLFCLVFFFLVWIFSHCDDSAL